jgi:hypothetical protein
VISDADIAHWRHEVPWLDDDQVEQDLVLSRLMAEIAHHPLLGDELVMRGGTCLHKLWLPRAWRYSEDLDYVRRSAGPVGPLLDALRSVAEVVGFNRVDTDIRQHPKARLRGSFNSGRSMRVKIEMNTFERSPARPPIARRLHIDSPWFQRDADVPTFVIEELVATKIRALYQRRKSRDLFDLWLAVHDANVPPQAIAACFEPYRPHGWTPEVALANLDKKIADATFATDLEPLVVEWPTGYTVEAGADAARAIIAAIEQQASQRRGPQQLAEAAARVSHEISRTHRIVSDPAGLTGRRPGQKPMNWAFSDLTDSCQGPLNPQVLGSSPRGRTARGPGGVGVLRAHHPVQQVSI